MGHQGRTCPRNLKIQKSAGTCSPGLGGGFDCFYLIQVTNTGPGVYSGSIEIDDQLSATPTPASWIHSLEWDCAVVGGDFRHCTHPPVVLGPDESVFLEMGVNVPDDFGECRLHNQVRITHAPVGDQNTDPADDVASASADIPSPGCVGPVTNLRIRKTVIGSGMCAPVSSRSPNQSPTSKQPGRAAMPFRSQIPGRVSSAVSLRLKISCQRYPQARSCIFTRLRPAAVPI